MATEIDTISAAVDMICKAAVLAASWAGAWRRRALEKIAALTVDDKDQEIILLREEVGRLREHLAFLQKQLGKGTGKRRYSIGEKLFVIFQMEYLGLPRRRVTEYFGVARSTLYRWLHRIDSPKQQAAWPPNKTPAEVAALVWEIVKANVDWGKVGIAWT